MKAKRTSLGRDIETALEEVRSHVRGEIELPGRTVDNLAAERGRAIGSRMILNLKKLAESDEHFDH